MALRRRKVKSSQFYEDIKVFFVIDGECFYTKAASITIKDHKISVDTGEADAHMNPVRTWFDLRKLVGI